LQKIVLHTIAVAGVISVALVAPNALGAMTKLGLVPSARQKESIRRTRGQLVKQGFLCWEGMRLRITEKGERKLRLLQIQHGEHPKPKRWDGKWRVLIFDIPEKRKGLREKVRHTIASVGFVRLQDSVWIYPYDCEDLVVLLKADFKIGKDMLYMIVDTLEYDTPVRHIFGLKQ